MPRVFHEAVEVVRQRQRTRRLVHVRPHERRGAIDAFADRVGEPLGAHPVEKRHPLVAVFVVPVGNRVLPYLRDRLDERVRDDR